MQFLYNWLSTKTLRSSYTGGIPDRFAGKNPTYYEAKQKSIGFSDTLALKSHTTFPVKSVGISSRLNGPLAEPVRTHIKKYSSSIFISFAGFEAAVVEEDRCVYHHYTPLSHV